jgi:putative ABC transport system permease protein
MWRTALASLRSHKRRLVGTCMAVLLGVAFLSGTLVLGDAVQAGFDELFDDANAGTDVLVRSDSEIEADELSEVGLLDASLVDELAEVDGGAAAVPVVERRGQIVGADGDPIGGNGPPTIAGNWIEDPERNPYHLVEGREPRADHEVVIDKGAAETGDLEVGDTTTVRMPEPIEVTVVGLAGVGSSDSLGPVTFAGFTLEAAQELLLPEPGLVTGVVLGAEEGLSQTELLDRVRPQLPEGTEALTGEALTDEQLEAIESDFLGFFKTFMLVFAGVALVVAAFSIYNTFSIVVAQKTRESALLRALGASRRQILTSVIVEAVVVGVVASVAGLFAGLGLAAGFGAFMDAIGLTLPSSSWSLSSGSVTVCMVVGLMVTLLASLGPAIKASRVLPLAALRDVAVDRSAASRWRAVLGSVVAAAGTVATVAGATSAGSLSLTGLGTLGVVAGIVLLGPVVARPASAVLGAPVAALRGMSGRLARGNAMRNPRRTANTASALMVGVAVVAMFTVVAASIKTYIDRATEQAFDGDLIVVQDNFSAVGLSPKLAEDVAALPEVEVAASFTDVPVRVDGHDEVVVAADPTLDQVMDLDVAEGSLADVSTGTVALAEGYAEDNGLAVGDALPVGFVDGTSEELTVTALYGATDLFGDILISKETWAPHAVQAQDVGVVIKLADGVSLAEGEREVQAVADRYFAPDAQTREEYVEAVASEVDQMLAVIYVLLILAIIIALMGIANTLSLSIHERTRELGLLRAVGQTRRQLRSMVRGESIIVAAFGAVGGIALGSFLGWAMFRALAQADDIDTDVFAIPVGQLGLVLMLGAVVGLVASVRPARRAARLDVLDAIATE